MGERKKVLLVDDDPAVVAYLVTKLGPLYDLVSTTDPREVPRLARSELPHLILCDIDMPGQGGGDVAASLSGDSVTARIPLVYLTALVSPQETKELGGIVGGRPGVSKRAPLAELVARIEEAAL